MELTQTRVRELFDYREDGVLISKVGVHKRAAGTVVGCDSNGYKLVGIDYKLYKLHRLIFLWHHGYFPGEVDHIDGNPRNNRIENLRAATSQGNKANRGRNKNNSSGYKGVTWDKRREKWVAQIMVNRKHIHLGQFDSAESAHRAYVAAAEKYFGEFARAA
jgi:hypothetical protein